MKKLISIIIAGLLLTGTLAYAEETAATDTTKAGVFKNLKDELKPQMEQIQANRAEIIKLRQEATTLYKETKKNVRELLRSKEDISQVQIEAIKESIDILVEDKKLLVETKGDIFKESIDLRVARRNRDVEAYKAALDEIISIQNSRINTLKTVIEHLKDINLI